MQLCVANERADSNSIKLGLSRIFTGAELGPVQLKEQNQMQEGRFCSKLAQVIFTRDLPS